MSDDLITLDNKEQPKRYPSLMFVDGQFLISLNDLNGNHVQKFVSPAHVRQAFTHLPVDSGWLPPDVVRWGMNKHGEWVITFIPPQVYNLPFIGEDNDESKVTFIKTPMPGLIFFGNAGTYGVWAVKGAQFDPFAKIYRSPLPNVGTTSEICYGVNKPPRANANTIGRAWKLFINSPFNNHTIQGKSKKHPEDVREMLRTLHDAASYPQDDLVPFFEEMEITIDKFFDGYIESQTNGGM